MRLPIVSLASSCLFSANFAVETEEFKNTRNPTPNSFKNVRKQEPYQISPEIEELLKEHPVLDGHNDLPYQLREHLSNQIQTGEYDFTVDLSENPQPWQKNGWIATDLPRAKKGHLGAQLWSVYVGCDTQYKDAIRQTIEQIDVTKRLTSMYPDDMQFCTTASCVRDAWKSDKFASLIGMEGGHHIDSSMAMIRVFHYLGARYMTLTHFCNTPWADHSSQDDTEQGLPDLIGGLTDFGKQVVAEMNRVGMMIDLAHVSADVMRDALEISTVPVMFSHSQAFGQYDNTRNAPDDVLLMLKENDGTIMVNFYGGYLCGKHPSTTCGMESVIDHLNYIRTLLGQSRNIGLGGDFDGVPSTVEGLEDVSMYPKIFDELYTKHSWSLDELKGLASENILRVLEETEKYANEQIPKNDWVEDWLSKESIDRVDQLFPEDDLKTCMTDYNLHPDTHEGNNYIPWEDSKFFELETVELMNVPDEMKPENERKAEVEKFKKELKNREPMSIGQIFKIKTDSRRSKLDTTAIRAVQFDTHNDLPWQFRGRIRNQIKKVNMLNNMRDPNNPEYWIPNHTDMPRAEIGGLDAEYWVAYVSCTSGYKDAVRQTFEQIDVIKRFIDMYPEDLMLATTADEVEAAVNSGKLASLICIEGGHSMDSSLEVLRAYAELGVRYMTLTHNCNTPWADNNKEDQKVTADHIGGMTSFGKKTVLEMNRLGIFIDISHVSADVMRDALNWSEAPVIFSHSNARDYFNHSRNAPDDVLDMLKENRGILNLVSLPGFVGDAENVGESSSGIVTSLSVQDMANHADYVKERIGHEYLGMGADFDGMTSVLNDMQDVSEFGNFYQELLKRGWTEDQVLDIKGRNMLRAMREMEATKAGMANQMPDETWIDRESLEKHDKVKVCRTDLNLHPHAEEETTTEEPTTTTVEPTTTTVEPTTTTKKPVTEEPVTEPSGSGSLTFGLVVCIFSLFV